MLVASGLGAQIDDLLEGAQKEYQQHEGAKLALRNAKRKVEEHQKYVDKDVEEGKLTDEQRIVVKKYVAHCAAIVDNLGIQAEVQTFQLSGKIQGLESSIKVIKQMYDTEKNKAEALELGPASLGPNFSTIDVVRRPEGSHPGNPIADRKEATDTASIHEDASINNVDVDSASNKQSKKSKSGKN